MKINKTNQDLKTRLEKLGYRVYFADNKIKLFCPWRAGYGLETYTFREAYRLSKGIAGNGKSVRPWNKSVKDISKRGVRANIRQQIHRGEDKPFFPPKLAADPWSYD